MEELKLCNALRSMNKVIIIFRNYLNGRNNGMKRKDSDLRWKENKEKGLIR